MSGELMSAEMREQPAVLARLAAKFDLHAEAIRGVAPERLAGVLFLARGSSDHAAVFGRYLAELSSARPAGLVAPSLHTLYRADVDYSGYLVVALSQSGATPEIVTVCERMRRAGARTVAIVNYEGSPLGQAADAVVPLDAGDELAVPATKTVTAELLAVAAVAAALGPVPFTSAELHALPRSVETVLDHGEPPVTLASRWAEAERLFVTARGLLLGGALEAALKIKETTSVLAEGISAADFRHGPIAAADRQVPVLALDGGGPAADDIADLVRLLRRRNVPVATCAAHPDAELPVPAGTPEALAVIPAVVRAQQLALTLADVRGLDADAPPGLSKVTATR